MSDRIESQRVFVQWLRESGMYNEFASASLMENMFQIWEKKQEEIERLKCKLSDYSHTLNFIATEKECPHCGKPMVNRYVCPHCQKDPDLEYSDNWTPK